MADKTTIIVFSGDLDKAMASFIIANGSAAMGSEVTMFFTFWGLNILRKENATVGKKHWMEKLFGAMMPKGPEKLGLSKMNMGGIGAKMMKWAMRRKNVSTLPQLIEMAREQGVKLVACTMSMDVLGIQPQELIDGIDFGGVAAYLGDAYDAKLNLFI